MPLDEVVGLVSLDWFRGTLAGNPYIDSKNTGFWGQISL